MIKMISTLMIRMNRYSKEARLFFPEKLQHHVSTSTLSSSSFFSLSLPHYPFPSKYSTHYANVLKYLYPSYFFTISATSPDNAYYYFLQQTTTPSSSARKRDCLQAQSDFLPNIRGRLWCVLCTTKKR